MRPPATSSKFGLDLPVGQPESEELAAGHHVPLISRNPPSLAPLELPLPPAQAVVTATTGPLTVTFTVSHTDKVQPLSSARPAIFAPVEISLITSEGSGAITQGSSDVVGVGEDVRRE
jgi:hypothetical protein